MMASFDHTAGHNRCSVQLVLRTKFASQYRENNSIIVAGGRPM